MEEKHGFRWKVGYAWYCVKLWFRERPDRIAWWVCYRLPRRVVLFAFVRVSATLDTPGRDYCDAYANWEAGRGR